MYTKLFIAIISLNISLSAFAKQTPTSFEQKIEVLTLLLEQDNIDKRYKETLLLDIDELKGKRELPHVKGSGITSFSGVVMDTFANPVEDHLIQISKYELGVAVSTDNTTTNASGVFSFSALPAGDYVIQVGSSIDGYIDYVFRETADGGPLMCSACIIPEQALINLADGTTRNDIDFTIQLGGVINGTIQDASTLDPVTTQLLRVYPDSEIGTYYLEVVIDASGNYTVKGIPDGSYKIFSTTKLLQGSEVNYHIPQIYGGGDCNYCYRLYADGLGTTLTIASANTINNVDFLLNIGATISGRLVDAVTLNPLAVYNWVYVVDENNMTVGSLVFAGTNTVPTETGDYTIGGFLPGSYYVQGGDLGREYYMREIFANKPCYWSGCDRSEVGDTVMLAANENRIGVNFILEKGGKISGTVTDASTGLPIPPSVVNPSPLQIFDASANVIGGAIVHDITTGAYTSARAIPAGIYSIKTGNMFLGDFNTPYIDEKYNDVPCPGIACDLTTVNVTVATEVTTTGIDFALSQGYSFSGTITDTSSGAPIAGVHVLVYKDMGTGLEPKFANWATTSEGIDGFAIGSFTVSGLPAGTYYAVTNNGSRLPFLGVRTMPGAGWIDILYNGMTCPAIGCDIAAGTPIVLPTVVTFIKGTSPTIDFSLSQGASIAGKVINFNDNAIISDVFINVYDEQGSSLGSYQTDVNGNYHTTGFSAGTYYLTTS
ncbi:hypothetical protein MNBD_GAMMA03-1614, partial [hydrothermal vent metagenome]